MNKLPSVARPEKCRERIKTPARKTFETPAIRPSNQRSLNEFSAAFQGPVTCELLLCVFVDGQPSAVSAGSFGFSSTPSFGVSFQQSADAQQVFLPSKLPCRFRTCLCRRADHGKNLEAPRSTRFILSQIGLAQPSVGIENLRYDF